MRNRFADVFYRLGQEDPRLAVVVADISPAGSIAKFREDFPDRFINTGVAEQVMIGLCAGMALRGMRPFAYTIAAFALFRTFEFVRDDLCYQDLPVTVVGIGGGVTYSTLGGTHHAMEDIAIAGAMPNMQIVAPCDPDEAEAATRWCALENQHPTYLRMGKAGEPDITSGAHDPFVFGKIRYLRKGRDVCLMSYGPTLKMVLDAADRIEAGGRSVSVIGVPTIKPLDADGVAAALGSHDKVLVVEEMVPHGGLGSRVKEVAWDTGAGCVLKALSLDDDFIHCYGDHAQLLAAHRLTADAIVEAV